MIDYLIMISYQWLILYHYSWWLAIYHRWIGLREILQESLTYMHILYRYVYIHTYIDINRYSQIDLQSVLIKIVPQREKESVNEQKPGNVVT